MKDFWDSRYSENNFAYGTEPNRFFAGEIEKLNPAKMLLPGDGEGRNAVFAASHGWDVTAVDYSSAGKAKAEQLAAEKNVNIEYIVADLTNYDFLPDSFDIVAVIFLHLHEELREKVHASLLRALKPGGVFIGEFFAKEQIKLESGGPKDINALYSLEDIYNDFHTLDLMLFSKEKPVLNEGKYHSGEAETIRIVGKKL